jgi:hypothetical protein
MDANGPGSGLHAKSPKASQIYFDKDGKPYSLSKTGKAIP